MAENDEVDPNAAPDETEQEAAALAVDMGGNKMVPLSALIAAKKEGKGYRDKVKELEPQLAKANEVYGQLENAQPVINAILSNPKLRAEALRISQGTRTTPDTSAQPDAEEDPDASAFAEDSGFYLADGQTVDVARARRVLNRLDARHGKQTDDRIRPLAGVTLDAKATTNINAALAASDEDGTPWATRESIEEVVKQLPRHLLADQNVADLILNTAIGIDRRKGRTPKAQDEPLFLESAGGRGRQREVSLTADERSFLAKSGITEKEYRASSAKLEQGAATRRGIELGK